MSLSKLAPIRQMDELLVAASLSPTEARKLQRQAKAGALQRIYKGVYVPAGPADEIEAVVRRQWQRLAGTIVPGAVVSHISAMGAGLLPDNTVTLSHPTLFARKVALPGVTFVLLRGPGPLPGDLPVGNSGLYWAGRARMLLENLGKKAPRRAGREKVETYLVTVLNASGERALNEIRDQAAASAEALGAQKNLETLRSIIGALLGTHGRGELRTRDGQLMAQGTPLDQERMQRFEVLAGHLRTVALPRIDSQMAGLAKHHFAFVESYFSNYVEGTKFDIEQARDIVMRNQVVASRPKDSHDILGVFRLATTSPYRDSPPVAGQDFLESLEAWHAEMLRMRPEAHPGRTKLAVNYAGTTRFVEPGLVQGTIAEGSRLSLSVPEGMARAIYYAFLISEVHPFEDGNGRLSRLVMNSELSRVGLCRIIIPTLYHPQYVDCARALTRGNDPVGFVRSLAKMARWCSQFNYADLDLLISALKQANALEESPAQYRLLNIDGTAA